MRSIEIPQPEDRDWRYRIFEILPLFISLLVLSAPLTLAFFSPTLVAYFVIGYLIIWFSYILGVNFRTLAGWKLMNQHKKLPWSELNKDLESLEVTIDNPKWHAVNLARVKTNIGAKRIKPSEIIQAVIIAFYNEPKEIVEATVKSVISSNYDSKKVLLILAYEAGGGPETEKTAKDLVQEYKHNFYDAMSVKHTLKDEEIQGKGANITYAGRQLGDYISKAKIDPLKVIVTTLDADNRPDANYFAALTYTYCSTEEPLHASYQPIPMFLNNIWDAPAPMRVVATGNSFWNIMLTTRHHMLRNFSSHSQSLATLMDTDYWSVRTVVEDGHQYWRTYFRYDGDHEVFPIHLPNYQDAVLTDSYKKTLKAQFYQVRRWAYGASDIAYVANQIFFRPNHIPKYKALAKMFRLIVGHVSWATMPLVLLLAGFPAVFLHPQSYIANQLIGLSSRIQMLAILFVFGSLFVSLKSLPPKPVHYKKHRTIWMILQWGYLPFVTIIYGSFAALNSQVRLAFGWYLGKFDVTEKAVKSQRLEVSDYLKR